MPIITEPQGDDISQLDERTQRVVYFQAGMADGTIKELPRIEQKTAEEIAEYDRLMVEKKLQEINGRIAQGAATSADFAYIDAVWKLKQLQQNQ